MGAEPAEGVQGDSPAVRAQRGQRVIATDPAPRDLLALAADAHTVLESRSSTGKLLLVPRR
ncbi:hypothetical protein GCM10022255_110460 [Dactylosporangium darangshiense]|uniref:Uncharacterized protein n=1 Tax=Dactylosporangium darangshiense TaxID=579108 RepID=A0ABP8DUS1_9ACTN